MNDNELIARIVWAVAFVVCVTIVTIGGCEAYKAKVFCESGYSEQVLPGSISARWVKTDTTKGNEKVQKQ